MRRSSSPLLLLGAFLGWTVAGAAGSGGLSPAVAALRSPAPPLNIAADEVTTDGTGTILLARGHVQVTYEGVRAKSDLLRWDRPAGIAKLTGHVVVTDPQGRVTGDAVTLEVTGPDHRVVSAVVAGRASFENPEYTLTADEITADRLSGRLAARGKLTMFSAPDVIITGERGAYDQHAQYAVVSGRATASNKEGRVQGEWIELFRPSGRAVVHGPVDAALYGATITGDEATVTFPASTAVFTGHVVVVRQQDTLRADRATLFYNDRRIVTEGAASARFTGLQDGTP